MPIFQLNTIAAIWRRALLLRPYCSRRLAALLRACGARTWRRKVVLHRIGIALAVCGGCGIGISGAAEAGYEIFAPPSPGYLVEQELPFSQLAPLDRLPPTTSVEEAEVFLDLSRADPARRAAAEWRWRILPAGIIYHPYMASVHESRLSGVVFASRDDQSTFDVALGGRAGLLRYGTADQLQPQGWQLDMEGAAFPRLALDHNWDVEATDFRFGVPLTYGIDNYQYKFSYYHLSSHLGDEFAIRNAGSLADRINYSRDALVFGASWYPHPAWRLYAEADWAFHFDDGNKPWEFLFGIDYAQPGPTDIYGTPFIAVNGHIREAVDFGGNLVVQTGWLWRGPHGHTLRSGFHYFNGKSNQFEFFDTFEQQVGFGIWYDQ